MAGGILFEKEGRSLAQMGNFLRGISTGEIFLITESSLLYVRV
jgi:hypothetical protein